FVLSELDAYSWIDASLKKSFFARELEVTLGARNLLNIKNIQLTQGGSAGIHAAGQNILLGYGRSFFLKLSYNINFK
ncbi:MAG TPA: TonB-dependent receptor, partial [Flavobacterium sp.]